MSLQTTRQLCHNVARFVAVCLSKRSLIRSHTRGEGSAPATLSRKAIPIRTSNTFESSRVSLRKVIRHLRHCRSIDSCRVLLYNSPSLKITIPNASDKSAIYHSTIYLDDPQVVQLQSKIGGIGKPGRGNYSLTRRQGIKSWLTSSNGHARGEQQSWRRTRRPDGIDRGSLRTSTL